MAYREVYPSELRFELKGTTLHVHSSCQTKYNPDLWGIKYLFDKGIANMPTKVYVDAAISSAQVLNTMALRMYFLRYLFPDIEFHDAESDKFIGVAEEIIKNVGTKYITYKLADDYRFDDRGTKEKLESHIEKELADDLSTYVSDFCGGAKPVRQFPANIFRDSISEETRVTDKLWIDMVSVNNAGELSAIELKVGGNSPLDLFAQGLDYGIYCHLFKRHIKENWFGGQSSTDKDKVTIYYIGEKFHPALVGRGKEKGIVSLIKNNKVFNIVFVKIKVDKNSQSITKSRVIFPRAIQ